MELQELLAFVDECYASDTEDQQQHKQARSPPVESTRRPRRVISESNAMDIEEAGPKTRPRRDAVEIAALQAQVAALTLQLQEMKQNRLIQGGESALLLAGTSHWVTETGLQSRRRGAAQEENERLRAKIQDQKQRAMRLVNALKRSSTSQVLQTLLRYERDAKLRTERMDDSFNGFDYLYHQTDAVLADAEMHGLPPTWFDARIRQQAGRTSFFVEIRIRMCMAYDHRTVSEAYWRFNPHSSFSQRFIFEQKESLLGEMRGYNFVFQPKHHPSHTRFYGQYLLRRYKTEGRVTVVWRVLIEPEEESASSLARLCGRGWSTVYGSTANGEFVPSAPLPYTSVQAVARYFPESKHGAVLNPNHILKDADLRTVIDFVTFGSLGYSAFSTQMALTENEDDKATDRAM